MYISNKMKHFSFKSGCIIRNELIKFNIKSVLSNLIITCNSKMVTYCVGCGDDILESRVKRSHLEPRELLIDVDNLKHKGRFLMKILQV